MAFQHVCTIRTGAALIHFSKFFFRWLVWICPVCLPTVADLISDEQVSVVAPPWLVVIGTVLLPMDQESGLAEMLITTWIVLNPDLRTR